MINFRELIVWQRGHALTLRIYRSTRAFPKSELFAMTGQIRRAAASIPANIAEGCGREGEAELKRFLNISLGSACELDYFILLATELDYLAPQEAKSLSREILELRRMIGAFIRNLKERSSSPV